LSTRAKEAFKVALSVTIAMGIALSMDWEKPYWAGFGVVMISLSTEGQSPALLRCHGFGLTLLE